MNIHITQSNLLNKRGWTDKLIKTFLPNPDKTEPNPRNHINPIKWYLLSRVEAIERSHLFQAAMDKVIEAKEKRKIKARDKPFHPNENGNDI